MRGPRLPSSSSSLFSSSPSSSPLHNRGGGGGGFSSSPSRNDLISNNLINSGEVFFLNLEDGFFGCQVNSSVDVLQLFEISKLCDGTRHCYQGSDENSPLIKCTSESSSHAVL